MKYFEEMNSKYGFNDGYSVPPDAYKCREVYCITLNKLLEKNDSICRIIPFDRPGLHNGCMWMRVPKDNLLSHVECEPDEAWTKSVDEAMELGLDEFVAVECSIYEDALEDFLEELCPTE